MHLRCVSRYAGMGRHHGVGEEFEVPDALGQLLLNDSPGSFVDLDSLPADADKQKSLDAPPEDKMVKRSPRQK